jgi:hypothetical protein
MNILSSINQGKGLSTAVTQSLAVIGQMNGRAVAPIQKASEPIEEQKTLSFGTLDILPPELVQHIFGFLLPSEQNQIKPVCKGFYQFASEQNQLPEYQTALKNLAIARSLLLLTFRPTTLTNYITTTFYLDQEGNLRAYRGYNIGLYEREGDTLIQTIQEEEDIHIHVFKKYEKKTGNLTSLTLYWKNSFIRDLKYYYSLGVTRQNQGIKGPVNDKISKVCQHSFILANQMWDGANEIAKEEGKKNIGGPEWEAIIADADKYPLECILEAGRKVKHLPSVNSYPWSKRKQK